MEGELVAVEGAAVEEGEQRVVLGPGGWGAQAAQKKFVQRTGRRTLTACASWGRISLSCQLFKQRERKAHRPANAAVRAVHIARTDAEGREVESAVREEKRRIVKFL